VWECTEEMGLLNGTIYALVELLKEKEGVLKYED